MAPNRSLTVPTDPDDLLAQQLRQLRREYLRDSDQRVDELRRLRARLAAEQPAALAALRQAFHRLAGSGGSYGFPDVSSLSREGERLVAGHESSAGILSAVDTGAIDRCIEGVADAFRAAKRSLAADEAGPGR